MESCASGVPASHGIHESDPKREDSDEIRARVSRSLTPDRFMVAFAMIGQKFVGTERGEIADTRYRWRLSYAKITFRVGAA